MRIFRFAPVFTALSCLAYAGSALAQEPAPAAPAAPAAEAPAAPAAETPAAPAPDAAPAAEEAPAIPGWFRIDSDLNGLQLWVGATHTLGGLALASDMYVYSYGGGSFGEFDLGPAFTAGPVIITPMIGINFNWTSQKTNAIVPQLYFTGGSGPIYFESWWQLFLQKPFEDTFNLGLNFLYNRDFITFALSDDFAVGAEIDPWISLDKTKTGDKTLMHLPVGPIVKLNYGKDNTFLGFVGYETQDFGKNLAIPVGSGDRALYGRLTFVKNW